MNEPFASRAELCRRRVQQAGARLRKIAPFAAGVLCAFLALLLYSALFHGPPPLNERDVNNLVAQAMASATPPPAFSASVYQAIEPSLVLVETKTPGADGKTENDQGSGVVIDDQGDILTALHVVDNATAIQLTFADGSQSSATVASSQASNDIAVLHGSSLPSIVAPATLGNPNAMRVGDEVYVVGSPFGLANSMSAGVISGFNRTFTPASGGPKLLGLIQFDAAANPGNSGGPLLNRDGQVIGIVDGIVNPTGQNVFIGIGLAVTINVATSGFGSPPD